VKEPKLQKLPRSQAVARFERMAKLAAAELAPEDLAALAWRIAKLLDAVARKDGHRTGYMQGLERELGRR
jgi:hypothetical protein